MNAFALCLLRSFGEGSASPAWFSRASLTRSCGCSGFLYAELAIPSAQAVGASGWDQAEADAVQQRAARGGRACQRMLLAEGRRSRPMVPPRGPDAALWRGRRAATHPSHRDHELFGHRVTFLGCDSPPTQILSLPWKRKNQGGPSSWDDLREAASQAGSFISEEATRSRDQEQRAFLFVSVTTSPRRESVGWRRQL